MSDSESVVDLVADLLVESKQYPWKTARYLSGWLSDQGCEVSPGALEDALLEHANRADRRVRYSFFPARKSMDLLWGHVDVVNNPKNLPGPHLEEGYGDFQPCDALEEVEWCFLSHSFRDLSKTRKIYDHLLKRGYGVWLAEAEVMTGAMIVRAVHEGMELCDRFVLHATPESLGSRWVLKEGIEAVSRMSMPVTIIIDEDDEKIGALFDDWLGGRWGGDLERRLQDLVSDSPPDPAATQLSDLLVAGLGQVPEDRRVVLQMKRAEDGSAPDFRDFDLEFPRQR